MLRIGVLSRRPTLYSTSRLVEAARAAGAEAVVLDTLRCTMVVSPAGSKLLYRGEPVTNLSVAIPRIGASITSYGMQVVGHLDAMGVPVVNGAMAIARSRDKVLCLQVLARGGIAVPRTVMAHHGASMKRLVEEVGGFPCIIKFNRGTQGVGVMLANTLAEATTIASTFWQLGQGVCLQEFVLESKGHDVRALVVGDKVVAAMHRTAKKGDFRANLHRGGAATVAHLDADYTRVAVEAARLVGLQLCGVDLLEGRDGPLVMELNSSPGFEGLERATKRDLAAPIISYALSLARATPAR